ncbi:MAG: TetR family transcriptional regulator [Paracoccaceae bacterium]|nr:MAG: TetR family transcriptional regulator [Paracoccaceae bacterium]
MPRSRTIPDADVFAAIRRLLAEGGDKAVAFGSVARATGLAAPTLVQRYGSREGMVRAAMLSAWDALDDATAAAETVAGTGPKGAQAMLKALGSGTATDLSPMAIDFRDADLRARAEGWRTRVEAGLAARLGSGARAREAAAMLFAAWQGQMLWQSAGGKGFRLKDAVKRLS